MEKLIFKIKNPEKRINLFLEELLDKKNAEKAVTETNATAKNYEARITLYSFDKDLINRIIQHPKTISAYIVKNNKVLKILKSVA